MFVFYYILCNGDIVGCYQIGEIEYYVYFIVDFYMEKGFLVI